VVPPGGGGVSAHTIVLTGLAGLAAGAFSMAAGEYVSVSSQNELIHAEVIKEKHELETNAAAEQAARPGDGSPGTDLVPLLAAREQAVDDTVEEMFGQALTLTRAARVTDAEGWNSGRAAADLASLNNRDQVAD